MTTATKRTAHGDKNCIPAECAECHLERIATLEAELLRLAELCGCCRDAIGSKDIKILGCQDCGPARKLLGIVPEYPK